MTERQHSNQNTPPAVLVTPNGSALPVGAGAPIQGYDPRPFLRHQELAIKWARWNGQKATARQVVKIMNQISAETLEQMLAVRGIQ